MSRPHPSDPSLHELEALRHEVARLRAAEWSHHELVESLNSIVLRWDPEGRVLYLNDYGQAFFGWPLDEITGRSVLGTIVPETETSGRDLFGMIEDLLQHPERYVSNENENVRRDGTRVWITWRNQAVLGPDGRLHEILSTGIDTSERKRAEEALRESERRYRGLFDSTPVALLERDASELRRELRRLGADGVDLDGALARDPAALARWLALVRTTDVNAALLTLLEVPDRRELEAVRPGLEQAAHGAQARDVLRAVAGDVIVSLESEATVVTRRGHRRDVVLRSTVVPGHDEAVCRVIVAIIDVTARKHAEEELRRLTEHDDLTGLYNTRYLYRALAELIAASRARGGHFSLVFMDLDRFKRVVDTYGHRAGSRAIQEVAATIRSALAEPAFAVAYAGDEFVIVLPGCDSRAAVAMAEDIRGRMRETRYLVAAGHALELRASFGVATYPEDAQDLEGLLALADRALFDVKRRGRDGVASAARPR